MRRKWENGSLGAVLVEFALAFPILLITFIFAIQLLFVFIYDILGSYAAFAATRSYSTLQNEETAKGVAAAIMSVWTIPVGDEERDPEDIPAGVGDFLEAMQTLGMGMNAEDRYRVACARMSDIKVEIEAVPDIYLKEGFEYAGADPIERPLGGFFGSFVSTVANWLGTHASWASPVWEWFTGLFNNDPPRYQARVGQVSFNYDFSQSMAFARFKYLGLPALAGDGTRLFSIHQRCAMPIEPSWKTEESDSDALEGVNHAVNYQQLLRDNNDVILEELNEVYAFLKETIGPIPGVHSAHETVSFENFLEGGRVDDRADRNRESVATWDIDERAGISVLKNSPYNGESVDWRYVSPLRSRVPDPLLVVKDMSGARNGELLKGAAAYNSEQTIDVLESLEADDDYRDLVIRNIDEEIRGARAEINSLEIIVGLEQAVCRALDRIRWLEKYIRDGGGWKTDSQWWNPSDWSRTKPSSDLLASQKAVYRTVTDSKGNSRRVLDYYLYKIKLRDDAAIAKAIKDQRDLIARLNGDISSERQNINYFLDPEEVQITGYGNTEDNSGWYDKELAAAQQRINGIIEVWLSRQSCERSLKNENNAIRERFIGLMNDALVPIADYYRIQRRILEDQQQGLDAVRTFSEALK